ncbi:carotenoid oxygenase family protein [Brevundimonas sp.]|uniref:carotenoid oxygenase family protein n=1 Tax=Brevundimonas sp. TaxID=1871086 RepID=UPI002FD9D82A
MSGGAEQPDRRAFLALAAAAGVTTAMTATHAQAQGGAARSAYADATVVDPRLVAFSNGRELDTARLVVEGEVPADLAGGFFRNGPAMFEREGVRYRHWFDGDGLMQRWRIHDGAVSYRSRFIQTSKYALENAASRFLLPVSGGGITPTAAFTGANSTNPSNTSVISMGGETWALWEGGSAMRLDPETLDTLGLVRWNSEIDGAPFSAHPRRGDDGRLWNVGSLGQRVLLYRLGRSGELEKFKIQPLGQEGYFHDFLLTRRSLVLIQCSTRTQGVRSFESGSFGSLRAAPDKPMRVHVFDRETFELVRESELPSGFAFHFGNAWEEDDGTINFDIVHSPDGDLMLEFFKPMSGLFPAWQAVSYRASLPPRGAPRFERLQDRVEFPTINPRFETRRNRYVYATAFQNPARQDWFDAVVKIDLERGGNQYFDYGPDWMVEEHVFVPRPGAQDEDDGWLVGTALNWTAQKSALTIFDAARPGDGFIARAWLDTPMPLGLHGHFRTG